MAAAGTSTLSNNWSAVWHKILGAVWSSSEAKNEPVWKQYLESISTEKKYFDDVERVGPGLWQETEEGADLDLDDFGQGVITRYEAKKFSKRLIIPEELEEDSQYEEIYDATRMLQETCVLTQDYDAVGVLNDLFTTANGRVGGDSLSLCSTVHPIRGGGTVSNQLPTALSPANTSMATMLVLIDKLPNPSGFITGGVKAVKVVGPSNYRFRMKEIWKSEQKDDTNNNAINSLMGEISNSSYVAVPFMTSLTNWAMHTNVKRGAMMVWRRQPRFRKNSDDTNETKIATGSARWTTGFSDFRTYIGSSI
jgi:hypothetical protein